MPVLSIFLQRFIVRGTYNFAIHHLSQKWLTVMRSKIFDFSDPSWKKMPGLLIIGYSLFLITAYRIVASTNTCYYSENQNFCIFKSRILTYRFFFLWKKTFLFVIITLRYSGYLTNIWCVWARISKRLDNFYFLTPMSLIEFVSIKGQLISKCFFLAEDSPKKQTTEFAFLVAI